MRFVQVSQPKWAKDYAKYFRYMIPGSPPNSLGEQSVLPMRAQTVLAAFLVPVSKYLAKVLKREWVRLRAMEDTVVCAERRGSLWLGPSHLEQRAQEEGCNTSGCWLLILARWGRLTARTDF